MVKLFLLLKWLHQTNFALIPIQEKRSKTGQFQPISIVPLSPPNNRREEIRSEDNYFFSHELLHLNYTTIYLPKLPFHQSLVKLHKSGGQTHHVRHTCYFINFYHVVALTLDC
jgi:hypothetical protein